MRRLILNQAGDTLIEVVLALVILTTVLVSAFGLARLSRVNSQNALLRSQAINMVQEQYEALREWRDSNVYDIVTHNSWLGFEQGVRNALLTSSPTCTLVDMNTSPPPARCVFHMERDPNTAPSQYFAYGQWGPCENPWNPPPDADPNWYLRGFCSRTSPAPLQPNITVQIQLMSPLACGGAGSPYVSFQVSAKWKQGGINSNGSTTLSTIVADYKNEATAGC